MCNDWEGSNRSLNSLAELRVHHCHLSAAHCDVDSLWTPRHLPEVLVGSEINTKPNRDDDTFHSSVVLQAAMQELLHCSQDLLQTAAL